MNLSDFTPHPDFRNTLGFGVALMAGILTLLVLCVDGLAYDVPEGKAKRLVNRIGTAAGVAAVVGLLGVVGTGLGAMGIANEAANESFHSALQATYGATTDSDVVTATRQTPEEIPVHTSRGNELVTFRTTGGKLVAFRADGTELPRG